LEVVCLLTGNAVSKASISNFWFSSIFIYEILSLHLVTTSKALL
jgi:hypothetical protein